MSSESVADNYLQPASLVRAAALTPPSRAEAMSLLALSHTRPEHGLYLALLDATREVGTRLASFSLGRLMSLSGLNSQSTVRRARTGLLEKRSIDYQRVAGDSGGAGVYVIYQPEEIFERRREAGLDPLRNVGQAAANPELAVAVRRLAAAPSLSRREAQIALYCADGLTNKEIGEELNISPDTVKFHLRHVFEKLGVKRRTGLTSRLLRRDGAATGEGGGAATA